MVETFIPTVHEVYLHSRVVMVSPVSIIDKGYCSYANCGGQTRPIPWA